MRFGGILGAALLALHAPAFAEPDLSGFWNLAFGARAEPDPALIAKLPPNTVVIEDTGAAEFPRMEFGGLKLKPAALASAEAWQAESERSAWQFAPVAFADSAARAAAEDRCAGAIETRVYYEPLHRMPAYRQVRLGAGGVAGTEQLVERLLCFPMANDLTIAEVERMAGAIRGRADDVVGQSAD